MCTLSTSYPNMDVSVSNLCDHLLEHLIAINTSYLVGLMSDADLKAALMEIENPLEALMAERPGDWLQDIEEDPHAALLAAKEVCTIQRRRWSN